MSYKIIYDGKKKQLSSTRFDHSWLIDMLSADKYQ
jgi:hypothetical protein